MTAEKLVIDKDRDREVAVELAKEIKENFNTGDNHLTSIKVCINPKHQKANIYADYVDESRKRGKGPDDSSLVSCEKLIAWPHSESLENTDETWIDFSFPKRQMERAFLLSQELNQQFLISNCADELNCYVKDGKAYIEKV